MARRKDPLLNFPSSALSESGKEGIISALRDKIPKSTPSQTKLYLL